MSEIPDAIDPNANEPRQGRRQPRPTPTRGPTKSPGSDAVAAAGANLPTFFYVSGLNLERFTAADFNLDQKDSITLRRDGCWLVLFYVQNLESKELAEIWVTVARQVPGPHFAAIDMVNENRVAQAFMDIRSSAGHSLHWAGLRQYPFIMVYRNGFPVAFYNGARETGAIVDFALTLACQANYYEPVQLGGSMEPGQQRLTMGPTNTYFDTKVEKDLRTNSTQYQEDKLIRGFSGQNVAGTGTRQEQIESNREDQTR